MLITSRHPIDPNREPDPVPNLVPTPHSVLMNRQLAGSLLGRPHRLALCRSLSLSLGLSLSLTFPAAAAVTQVQGPPTRDSTRAAADTTEQATVRATVRAPIQVRPLVVEVLRTPQSGNALPFAIAGDDLGALPVPATGAALSDALMALPGLQLQNRFNYAVGERVVVRGFGARAQFGVRGIRAVLDGIPATLPDGQTTLDHVDPAALGRVELLRGPGSAWWGNAAGGVLFMRSRDPAPGKRTILGARTGSFGLLETTAALEDGGQVAGDPVTRIGLTGVSWDGFRADPLNGGTYGSSERWIVTGRHARQVASGELVLSLAALDLDAENPGSLPLDSLFDDDRSAWGNNVRQRLGKTVRQAQLGASWRSQAGNTGASPQPELAAWVITRELRNPIPGTVVEVDRVAGGARAGLEGTSAELNWAIGAEVEVQRDDRRNFANNAGANGALTLEQFETVVGTSLFARAGTRLRRLDMQAALRWDRIGFKADDRLIAAGERDESGSRTLQMLSPSLGLRLPLREPSSRSISRVDAFGSISAFIETPTTTELANRPDGAGGFNPELDPTRGWTSEFGLEGQLGARTGWEAVVFRTWLRDELVPFEVPADPGRTFFRNAARSSHEGIELAVRTLLPGDLGLRMAWTSVNARFDEGQGEAIVGNRIPGRAPHRFEARLTHDEGPVRGLVDLVWSDAIPTNDANTGEAPGWWRVDLRGGPAPVEAGGWRLHPWFEVGNLLDEQYVGSVVVNAFGGRWFEPAPGRSFAIGGRLELGTGR